MSWIWYLAFGGGQTILWVNNTVSAQKVSPDVWARGSLRHTVLNNFSGCNIVVHNIVSLSSILVVSDDLIPCLPVTRDYIGVWWTAEELGKALHELACNHHISLTFSSFDHPRHYFVSTHLWELWDVLDDTVWLSVVGSEGAGDIPNCFYARGSLTAGVVAAKASGDFVARIEFICRYLEKAWTIGDDESIPCENLYFFSILWFSNYTYCAQPTRFSIRDHVPYC